MSLNIDLVHFLIVIVFSFLIGLEVKSYRREFYEIDTNSYFFGDVRTYTFIGILGFILFKIDSSMLYLLGFLSLTILYAIFTLKIC